MSEPSDGIPCDPDSPCQCVASDLLSVLGRKYVPEVLCVLAAHDRVRFGELEDHLPAASTSTLSNRLEELTDAGLVERERYDEIPPRVEYELAGDGRELSDRLRPLLEWLREREAGG